MIPYIEAMAKLRGISVEEVLSTLLSDQLVALISERARTFDGLFDGPGDLSERNEDIMYGRGKGE